MVFFQTIFPETAFCVSFFCFCFDVLCQTSRFSMQEVSATQKFTPRQSHPPEPQRTVSRCLLCDLRGLKVMMMT